MPTLLREPRLRLLIGSAITLTVWTLYIVRLKLGIGPMHDDLGNQAPLALYLAGAIIGTSMVAAWSIFRAVMPHKSSQK
jgi:hypothetical protein